MKVSSARKRSHGSAKSSLILPSGLNRPLLVGIVILAIIAGYVIIRAHAAGTGMRVSGNTLTRDGVAFVPRGFNTIGTLAPPGCSANAAAKSHFGTAEFTAARDKWHANTLRFQVSQSGLAGSQSATYIGQIKTHVAEAEALGLVVILSMQDQSLGCGPAHPLPSAQTTTSWTNLAPAFKTDNSVMFELFNEPDDPTSSTAAAWPQWQNGGTTPESNLGDPAVGHQQLVRTIRNLGANNVLIADGENKGEHLEGMPLLTDTLSPANIAYATHPYYYQTNQTDWNTRFGYLASTRPVLATEWNYLTADCGTSKETMAPTFLTYLKSRGIGVFGHALDAQVGTGLVADWSWNATSCASSFKGAGLPFMNYLTSFPAATATPTTPPPTTPPPSPSPRPTTPPPSPSPSVLPSPSPSSSVTPRPTPTPDTKPPSLPGNLTATLVTDTQIALRWDASSDASGVTGYRLYRAGTQIADQTTIGYVDQGLAAATDYTYGVEAYDAARNVSARATLTVHTLDPPPTGSGGSGGAPGGSNPLSITPDQTTTPIAIAPNAQPVVADTIGLSTTGGTDCANTAVKIDGGAASSNGQLDTTYLINGTHTVTTSGCNAIASRTVQVQNKLSWWQSVRNTIFAGFHGNKTIINGTLLGLVTLMLIGISWFAWRLYRNGAFRFAQGL